MPIEPSYELAPNRFGQRIAKAMAPMDSVTIVSEDEITPP